MAEYISFQPKDFFSPKIYTGNGTAIGSGGLAVTGVGFQPDFTWIKNREQLDDHILTDAVRGATKYITSDATDAEVTNAESLTTWGADGFTLGNHAAVNTSAEDYASWNWKAGTTTGLTGGTITPSAYSINTTSGFSAIAYTGTTTGGETIPHGLGVAPEMVICKKYNTTGDWKVYHSGVDATAPEDYQMVLNTTAARDDSVGPWYDTAPTSTLVTLGTDNNASGTHIAYCFAPIRGYSAMGFYRGNVNADGPFIYTGFRPAFVLTKPANYGSHWVISDDKRPGYNPAAASDLSLQPNSTASEVTEARMDLLSNGFKINSSAGEVNQAYDYIYSAFAAFPIVSSNDVPTVAR